MYYKLDEVRDYTLSDSSVYGSVAVSSSTYMTWALHEHHLQCASPHHVLKTGSCVYDDFSILYTFFVIEQLHQVTCNPDCRCKTEEQQICRANLNGGMVNSQSPIKFSILSSSDAVDYTLQWTITPEPLELPALDEEGYYVIPEDALEEKNRYRVTVSKTEDSDTVIKYVDLYATAKPIGPAYGSGMSVIPSEGKGVALETSFQITISYEDPEEEGLEYRYWYRIKGAETDVYLSDSEGVELEENTTEENTLTSVFPAGQFLNDYEIDVYAKIYTAFGPSFQLSVTLTVSPPVEIEEPVVETEEIIKEVEEELSELEDLSTEEKVEV